MSGLRRVAYHVDRSTDAGMSQIAVAHPWVNVDTISETVACERCGKAEYVRNRAAEVFLETIDSFLKVHRHCRPDGALFDNRKDLQ